VSNALSRRSVPLMGTIITISVPGHDDDDASDARDAIERAFQWFRHVERCCSRFDPQSELLQLAQDIGTAVQVSDLLFEAVQFALNIAEESEGAFDPTIGASMEARGFNRDYATGHIVEIGLESDESVTYQDVLLDPEKKTITLLKSCVLDLGAVAKGMATDLAARELRQFGGFTIDAGGDLYLGGCNPDGDPWIVGIRHPRLDGKLIDVIQVSNCSVCTSGDYEREHHILDPRRGVSSKDLASATVVAPTAMLADAAATAAFVMGPEEGIRFLDRLGVDGLLVSPSLDRYATEGMSREYKLGATAIL
jgi:thiamine biosynthesis lipoprotein